LKTISILSQKGGAGKTTVAVHLAVAATAQGLRTALVDLDPQATGRKWGDKREAEEPDVIGDHANRLPQLAEYARANGADILVVDTAPNADQASLIAARAADFILIPCRPAAFDLEAIEATIDLARIARKPFAVVLNAAPHQGGGLVTEARKGIESMWSASVCPITLHARVAFSHSVIDGRSALEFEPDGKAADEVRKLFAWTCGQVGMETRRRAHVAA
jgi:chromosome partitioning protein